MTKLMTKLLSISALFVFALAVSADAAPGNSKAPCGSFQKLSDGKWNVVKPIKIESGTTSVILQPGTLISQTTRITGIDIYAALQKNCQGNTVAPNTAQGPVSPQNPAAPRQ